MTGFEIFGLVLSGTMTLFAVILTMLGAEAAKRRQIADAIVHLRWSGIMTFTSFMVMVSLFYKCETICWITQRQKVTDEHTSEFNSTSISVVSTTPRVEYTSPAGVTIGWTSYAGIRSMPFIRGRSGSNSVTD